LSSERLNRIENMFAEAIKQKEIPGTCSIDH
jgi:hypothetical protein